MDNLLDYKVGLNRPFLTIVEVMLLIFIALAVIWSLLAYLLTYLNKDDNFSKLRKVLILLLSIFLRQRYL